MDILRPIYLGVPNFLETYGIVGFIIIGFISLSVQYGIIVQVALLWLYAGLFYLTVKYGPSIIMICYLGIRLDEQDEEEERLEPTLARLKQTEPFILILSFLFIYSFFYYNTTYELEVFIFRVKVFLLKYANFGLVAVYPRI